MNGLIHMFGAETASIMTHKIMTVCKIKVGTMTLSIVAVSITIVNLMTVSIMILCMMPVSSIS